MPTVRMNTAIADRNYSLEDGQTADVSAELAQQWVAAGIASYVTTESVDTPERRQRPTEVRRRPGRPRKY